MQLFTQARRGLIVAAITAVGVSLLTSAPALAHARVRHGIGWLPSLTTLTNDAIDVLQKEAAGNAKPEFHAQGLFLTALAQFSAAQEKSSGALAMSAAAT